ncbi:MAG: hypothetical protein GY757_35130 [bacterium]|nr:hypothetical protein [bacterium]
MTFTPGIRKRKNHHIGLPAISSIIMKLYIGMRHAQPGFPAFTKVFHIPTITTNEINVPNEYHVLSIITSREAYAPKNKIIPLFSKT